jgi:hypothetical protein
MRGMVRGGEVGSKVGEGNWVDAGQVQAVKS